MQFCITGSRFPGFCASANEAMFPASMLRTRSINGMENIMAGIQMSPTFRVLSVIVAVALVATAATPILLLAAQIVA